MSTWWDASVVSLTVSSRGALVKLEEILPSTGRIVVARLDGTKMFDADHALYEFSDALLFPGYFGWNWDALSDCLHDLDWLPADGYLIVVENATRVLPDDATGRHTLFRILIRAARHWSSPLGKTPVAFKVMLLCDDEAHAKLLEQEIVEVDGLPS